jgi:hypothetical protein
MVDLDKYLISQKHCCHKVFNQNIFYFLKCEIEINDWMWMLLLSVRLNFFSTFVTSIAMMETKSHQKEHLDNFSIF